MRRSMPFASKTSTGRVISRWTRSARRCRATATTSSSGVHHHCDGSTVGPEEVMGEYIDDAETIVEDGIDPAKMFTIWEGFGTHEGDAMVECSDLVDLHPDGHRAVSHHSLLWTRTTSGGPVHVRAGGLMLSTAREVQGNGPVPGGFPLRPDGLSASRSSTTDSGTSRRL